MENKLLDIDKKAIGIRMRRERERLELTREKFAEIVDLSPLYIGQLERGDRQMSLLTLVKIAKSLHVSTDYLIYGKDNSNYVSFVNESEEGSIYSLLSKCSKKELDLIKRMIKLIMPYIR